MQRAAHPNAARVFPTYLFSPQCQQIMSDDGRPAFVPSGRDGRSRAGVPLSEIKLLRSSPEELAANGEEEEALRRDLRRLRRMDATGPAPALAETLAAWIAAPAPLPAPCAAMAHRLLLDVAGLCVAARHESLRAGHGGIARKRGGGCTALGHAGGFGAYDAALVNGTAAHGEDFDDTFEGGPVHSGAVVVPAVLAAVRAGGLGRRGRCCAAS